MDFSVVGTWIGDELSFDGSWMGAFDVAAFVESEELITNPLS
jgi:hypothetical protein